MISVRLTLARRDFTLDVALQLPERGITALFGPKLSVRLSVISVPTTLISTTASQYTPGR